MPDINNSDEHFNWADISDKEKKAVYDKIRRSKLKEKVSKGAKKYYDSVRREKFKENPEQYLWLVARTRARKLDLEFNIDVSDIVIPEKCPILGMVMTKNNGYNPSSISLDRVDNDKGYIKGNVRVISRKANIMKSALTLDILKKLIKYIKGEL